MAVAEDRDKAHDTIVRKYAYENNGSLGGARILLDRSDHRSSSSRRRMPSFQRYIKCLAAIIAAASCCCVSAFSSSVALFSSSVKRYESNSCCAPTTFKYDRIARYKTWGTALHAEGGSNNKKEEPDEPEWRALIAAFQMYKAAYGDLKVPSRFIVPAMPPWPKSAWNVKLGQRVAAIRSTGRFVQNNERRRKQLEDMGFVWRLRATYKNLEGISFDQIYDALVTYRNEVQNDGNVLRIPPNFVVPDCDPWPQASRSMPLGKLLPTIRSKNYLKSHPGAIDKLQRIRFEFDGKAAANDARFNKVYEALKTYKDIYGDLLIPQPFVVPDQAEDWPEETWGLRLGARVNAIRSQGTFINNNPARKELLDELGFVWSLPAADGRTRRRRRKREEIEALMAQAPRRDPAGGDLLSSSSPLSASSDQEDTSDGSSADDSLLGSAYAQDPFLVGKDSSNGAPTWAFENDAEIEAARKAEEAKKAEEEEFKPPRLLSETLKEAAERAAAVGIIEYMTEENRIKKGKRDADIPWYNDDFGEGFVFDDVVEALTVYKSIHTNFSSLVENDKYMVPSLDSIDDEIDGGLSSFDAEASERAAAAIAVYEERGQAEESEDLISAEIKRLQAEVDAPVSMETEVALADKQAITEWPEHLAGMPLGNVVRRIRDGSLEVKHLPERKAQLDAIEFDWGDPNRFLDIPFEKAMCAMLAYFLIRGDMFAYPDFVVPDEDPWPKVLAGYELGKTVERIRELQNFMEAYHPEKVSLLRSIDFMWFPNLALPIDPNEGEMTTEMLLVTAHGHPDYAKMVDIPLGLPEKIMADGPFFETDDPKQWWRKWHNWDYVKDYWHAHGRRDNAFHLRQCGYYMLADEHEAKYGPGMFQQLNETMAAYEKGVDDYPVEEKAEFIKKLKYFRNEMTGCKDIHKRDRDKIIEDLDEALLKLLVDVNEAGAEAGEDFFEEYEYEEEVVDETGDGDDEEEYDEELVEEEEYEEEEYDVEDELGL